MISEGGPSEHGRERRKRATRRALRAATLELGLAYGMEAISVAQIADRAGVSTRTFFNYFATKEDAALLDLFTLPASALAALATGDVSGAGTPLWSELTRLFVADIARLEHEGRDVFRYLALQARHPALQGRQLALFAQFESDLGAAIATRLERGTAGQLHADLIAGSCITAVRVGLRQWAAVDWAGPAEPHIAGAFAVLAPAFREIT